MGHTLPVKSLSSVLLLMDLDLDTENITLGSEMFVGVEDSGMGVRMERHSRGGYQYSYMHLGFLPLLRPPDTCT